MSSRVKVEDSQQRNYHIITHYAEKHFVGPNDVAVGPNEEILVVDTGNDCVVVMDKSFDVITVIGKNDREGKLTSPYGEL